ncbi:hypothetical protein [Bradyrhizobium liaoningense]
MAVGVPNNGGQGPSMPPSTGREGNGNVAAFDVAALKPLDHAEHDSADEGHGEVGGDNAQSASERHEVALSRRAALRAGIMVNRESPSEKVRLAVDRAVHPDARARHG